MRIVTGVLSTYRDLATFATVARLSPGFDDDMYGRHALLMFDSEVPPRTEPFLKSVSIVRLGALSEAQRSIQCVIKIVRWFKIARMRYSDADFIGWQDADTWIHFGRLHAFLNTVPNQDRPRAYVGLPQYMHEKIKQSDSVLPVFSKFAWSCKKDALFFTQGMLTYFGRQLAHAFGDMDSFVESFQHYKNKSKSLKCLTAGDVTSGFVVQNAHVRNVRIYSAHGSYHSIARTTRGITLLCTFCIVHE